MKDIKYSPVAIIKGIDVPFILIERAFSVPFYALLNSKTVIFELGHSWIKWALLFSFIISIQKIIAIPLFFVKEYIYISLLWIEHILYILPASSSPIINEWKIL